VQFVGLYCIRRMFVGLWSSLGTQLG